MICKLYSFFSLRLLLLAVFSSTVIPFAALAGMGKASISNVRTEIDGAQVQIYYDLSGEENREYFVSVSLRKKASDNVVYQPVNISGDAGTWIHPHENHSIVWDASNELANLSDLSEYTFDVSIQQQQVASEGISPWLWVAGAVLVGGLVYLLASSSKDDTQKEFPEPPGRP